MSNNQRMPNALLLLPIVLPVIFWAGYHYHKDRHLPEPLGHLALTFVLGMAAAGVSQFLYAMLDVVDLRFDAGELAERTPIGLLAYALLAIGPIEEIAKALPFLLFVIRFREFDEPIDGFIYASFIALGYATVENWQYLEFLTPLEATARGIASPFVHILFASIWAHRITPAVLESTSVTRAATAGIMLAAGAHGAYDFVVLLKPETALPVAAAGLVGIWLWRLKHLRDLHHRARDGARGFGGRDCDDP